MPQKVITPKEQAEIDELVRITQESEELERRLAQPQPFGEVLRSTFRLMFRSESVEREGEKSGKVSKA